MSYFLRAVPKIGNIEDLPHTKLIGSLRDCRIATASDLTDHGTANYPLLIQKANIRGPAVRTPKMSAEK